MKISKTRLSSIIIGCIQTAVLCSLLSGCGKIIFLSDPLSAKEHADLASTYEEQGQYDLAIREAGYALGKDSKNLTALIVLGNSHLQKGNHKAAEKYYSKALNLDPENPDVLNNMAWMYLSMDLLNKAEEYAKKAIAKDSPNKGYYYDTLGMIYEKMGRMNDAEDAFDRARILTTVPPFLK